ncbi:MAG: hypothetical protein ACBZ72_00630 [Candidatus Bathyarchaeia archaeon]|jgi:hypothetical protein
MKKTAAKKGMLQTLDLAILDGEGSFPCPTCGTLISPDDESEDIYQIVDTKMAGDELEELIICCNTCKTDIRITGFQQMAANLPNE